MEVVVGIVEEVVVVVLVVVVAAAAAEVVAVIATVGISLYHNLPLNNKQSLV